MKLLIHVCCAPCFTSPFFDLKKQDISVKGYFFNPNIHPFKEFKKRIQTLKSFAQKNEIDMIYDEQYGLYSFLDDFYNKGHKDNRCYLCYETRLKATAQMAKQEHADAFSTTMLLSPYLKHDQIIEIAQRVSKENDIPFYYKDWRPYFKESIMISKENELYRQSYCGCIFSEYENTKKFPIIVSK